jgi:FkbM family methyltransferase
MSTEKRAVVMISIGDRPWSAKSSGTFAHYCSEINADMHLIKEFPTADEFPFPDLPDSPGRKHKRAYASKAYFAWRFLEIEGYDRVVVVDDTCCVRPGANNIFEVVPEHSCGYTGTSGRHAEQSFDVIRKYIEKNKLPDIAYIPHNYMNSGVMVYHRSFRDALHWQRICDASDLLYARYPNQTLTYYLLKSADVPMFRMPKSFNSIPAMTLSKASRSQVDDISEYVTDSIFIYHITGAFKNRGAIVMQLSDILLKGWQADGRPALAAMAPEPATRTAPAPLAGPAVPSVAAPVAPAASPAQPPKRRKAGGSESPPKPSFRADRPDSDILPRDELSDEIERNYNTHAPHFSFINGGVRRIAVNPVDKRARSQLLRHDITYISKIQALVLSVQAHLETDLFVDVGVNYGECLFSAPIYSKTKFVGFEANADLFGYIEKSMIYNDDLKDVTLVRKGVSDTVGTTSFFVDMAWSGQSTAVNRGARNPRRVKEVTIETTTLDVESASWGEWKRGLIKVDVEGLEPEVLAGAATLNTTTRDLIYLIEFDTAYMSGDGRASPSEFFKRLQDVFEIYVARSSGLKLVRSYDDLLPLARENGRIHCDLMMVKVGKETHERFRKLFIGRSVSAIVNDIKL